MSERRLPPSEQRLAPAQLAELDAQTAREREASLAVKAMWCGLHGWPGPDLGAEASAQALVTARFVYEEALKWSQSGEMSRD
jgi:hypothetical protein